MPLDAQTAALLAAAARSRAPHYRELSPVAARTLYEKQAGIADIKPIVLPDVQDIVLDLPGRSVNARLYYGVLPTAWRPLPVLLFFHGGGFTIGSVRTHDAVCRMLADRACCAVLSVDYRLAPEHKFPTAVDDAWDSLDWLLREAPAWGLDPYRIAVGGDSAGGTLAAVTAIHARDQGISLVLQCLIYPGTSGHQATASHTALAEGYLLEKADIDWFFGNYLRNSTDRNDWRFAPLDATPAVDLTRLAPAWICVAEYDPLVDEGIAYAEKLRAAGVLTDLMVAPGMVHGFFQFGGWVDAARVAHDAAINALKAAFGQDRAV
jgi:acetyl esterase